MKNYFLLLLFFIAICFTAFVKSPFISSREKTKKDSAENRILLLMRHAKSSHDVPNQSDFDRPLDSKGKKEAVEMGKYLVKTKQQIDLVIASPSVRTTETATLVCKEINYEMSKVKWDSTIYRCSDQALVNAIKSTDNQYKKILVIGHNPAITHVANSFQKEKQIEEVPTSGIVAIEFQVAMWDSVETGKLLFFKYPD